jgi:hypothetical protein
MKYLISSLRKLERMIVINSYTANKERNESNKYKGKEGTKIMKGRVEGTERQRERDRQCVCNVTYRRVRATIVAVGKQ